MNLQRQSILLIVALAVGGYLVGGSLPAAPYNDVTKVNVLRQYDRLTGNFLISTATSISEANLALSGAGGGFTPSGAIDGGGSNVQTGSGNFTASDDVISQEFTLPGIRRVGSYSSDHLFGGNRPTNMLIEGFDGTNWVTLANFAPSGSGNNTGSFSAANVTKIRYTATGPGVNGNFFTYNELSVFLAADAPVPDHFEGFNILRDTLTVQTSTTSNTASHSGNGFYTPNGSAGNVIDADVTVSNVNLQVNAPPGTPANAKGFLSYTFVNPEYIKYGNLGGFHGQGWDPGGWSFWTSNLLTPNPAVDADWTLQYTDPPGGGVVTQFFGFQPGFYKHARLTWNVQSGAISNFELFAPEPAGALLLGLGGLLLFGRCRRRNG